MGYYTNFYISFDISNNPETVQQAIEDLSQCSFYNGRTDQVKWHSWKEHCIRVSKDFPDIVINIEGEGKESGDHWKAYIKNGKIQISKAVVTFEEFNEGKLK